MSIRTIQIGDQPISASVIAFDKDGTLFQAEPFWIALNKERKKRFISIAGLHNGDLWDRMMGVDSEGVDHSGLLAIAGEEEEKIAIAALIYQQTKKPWVESLALSEKLLEESNRSLNIKDAFIPTQGAKELLYSLKEAGYVVGIVTSDQHDRTVECLKLLDFHNKADFIVTPASVAHGKPAPDMLDKVLRNFTVPAHEVLVVGDSIVDLMMSKAAGCKSVLVNEKPEMLQQLTPLADYAIEGLDGMKVIWEKRVY
ncbi:HAD family hydrolase [Jeotgalibacillus sp. R-1-5s-1]|uniref:HAD family hydrolase n=1 Tax=Jeotgalibacillus sp. R-1-5s-1 TaxID=2555897 RepID=UPI00106BE256|nr:HAD family hydrolase [Jeotgalibacillus sp. R-1-5s-1]TFD95880.1 HAD family hydrolase [Jeotgalibacillus sp. R-1-5s-1]